MPGLTPPLRPTDLSETSGGDRTAQELFPHLGHGVEWGLDRTRSLLSEVGDPHLLYPSLHVGGTNGKGSVASIWATVLRETGMRVGLYTSPHLCRFGERIQVDGHLTPFEVLSEVADDLRGPVSRHGPTFFEAATALAFKVFAREAVDVAVVEVGLGGRLDATNVIDPELTCITNVSLDHADYLGGTLEAIALEKAGIIKSGVPVHTAESDPAIRALLEHQAEQAGAPFHPLDRDRDVHGMRTTGAGTRFSLTTSMWGELELAIPLVGAHQGVNAALAVQSLQSLPVQLRPTREAVERGLASVRWPGRVQVVQIEGTRWVFDVAHNAAGMEALVTTLESLRVERPLIVLAGVLGDKDWGKMLPGLFSLADGVILTQPPSAPSERRWDPALVAASMAPGLSLVVEIDFERATAMAAARARGGTAVVTGSCHTVGDALQIVGLEPFGP